MLMLLAPIKFIIAAVIFFVISDLFCGAWASILNGDIFQPTKLRNTLAKIFFYNLLVLTGFVFETFIVPEIPMIKILAGLVCGTEVTSIMRNVGKILGVNLFEALKLWLRQKRDIEGGRSYRDSGKENK